MNLSHNRLSGPIPPELGQLTNLAKLYLNNNSLAGPIPPELGNLTNLMWLDLSSNKLTGAIPPELAQLTRLLRLDIHQNNQLTGCVPAPLARWVKSWPVCLGVTDPVAAADFDGDGEVGFDDFFLFADAFGGSDDRFDLNGNGAVDLADFFLFADHFGQPARAKLLVMAQELIGLPDDVQLHQNVPNPFNRQTLISFLMRAPGPARVELFALTGQRVAVLSQGFRRAGSHPLHWDGRDDDDRPLASGTYLYRLVTTDGTVTRKLTLLR